MAGEGLLSPATQKQCANDNTQSVEFRKGVGTMAGNKKPKKCRNMMYEQQIAHLPEGKTVDDLFQHIDDKLHPKRWAGIVHNRDLKADNKTLVDEHVHVMMQFENARSLNQVAKELGDEPQFIEAWNDNVENGFAYLVHATTNARHKHQYSADQVRANFNYIAELERITKKAKKVNNLRTASKIDLLLDMVASGDMTLKDAKSQLSGSEYARANKKLEAAHSLFLERRADILRADMKNNGQIVQVHWIVGDTGSGKTRLAKDMAERLGDYYITTTSKDPFQYYQAEPVVILDEFRPGHIDYQELLAMFDPFSYGNVRVSSRYYNKALACHTFFITSPFGPSGFYERTVPEKDRHVDKAEQLFRRITSLIEISSACQRIVVREYDEKTKRLVHTKTATNEYYQSKRTTVVENNILNLMDWLPVKEIQKK